MSNNRSNMREELLPVGGKDAARGEGEQAPPVLPASSTCSMRAYTLSMAFWRTEQATMPEEVGLFLGVRGLVAHALDDGAHALRVGLVHLAPEVQEVVFHPKIPSVNILRVFCMLKGDEGRPASARTFEGPCRARGAGSLAQAGPDVVRGTRLPTWGTSETSSSPGGAGSARTSSLTSLHSASFFPDRQAAR